MDELLSSIRSPQDLQGLSGDQLKQLAYEMREALYRLVSTKTAHFASNLGVIELALALHTTFDFSRDRLIWDTGHQIYPHKMLTGRYQQFPTIRDRGGLMGYPNPAESLYDLFMTGHAGCSVATALGLQCGDELIRPGENRQAVAVIGDGAFSSGIVFEAMNHAGGLKRKLTVVLNDNKMSICPRVGGLSEYLDRLRMTHFYSGLKVEVQKLLNRLPMLGDPVEKLLTTVRDAIKAGILGGMLFEELGFRYVGPVDGHNIAQLQKYLAMARDSKHAVLVHVVTEKGHGFKPAVQDPTAFHAPAPFARRNGSVVALPKTASRSYTAVVRDAIQEQMRANPRVVTITAAMCQGNMLEPIRDEFPDRFHDVGICDSHGVALAAGMAKVGVRPIVDIYSTFLQRAYDQIFQEVALQNLPVTLSLDRAGCVGSDGPTHHGMFDIAYLRPLPNLTIMAPGHEADVAAMFKLALGLDGPAAIRYPKAQALPGDHEPSPLELGKAEILRWGLDGAIVAYGTLLHAAIAAADVLSGEGLDLAVINARFVKPLDSETMLRAIRECPFVVTVEEGTLLGGFGSAVLEAANDAGMDTSRLRRLGIPDQFIEHGNRDELLADLKLDRDGIAEVCREMAGLDRLTPKAGVKAR